MSVQSKFQICTAYLQAHLGPSRKTKPGGLPAVAITRSAGLPMAQLEEAIVKRLNETVPGDAPGWVIFDDNLVDQVLRDAHLPADLASHMPEDRFPRVQDILSEIFLHTPTNWELFEKNNDTIFRLAKLGHCILVGRGAGYVTRSLPNVLKLNLTAPLDFRVCHVANTEGISLEVAQRRVEEKDQAIHRYLVAHFGRDALDDEGLDLSINVARLSPGAVADLVATAVLDRRA